MMSRAALCSAVVLAGCATYRTPEVFAQPQAYVGQEVRVCGVREYGNLLETNRGDRGLVIVQAGPLGLRSSRHVCVEGEIEYVGCLTDPNVVCVDWAYDYGIIVRRLAQ
jgi:hypothetical protein